MQSRKNVLFLALILNCIYFLGVSFFVHRQLSSRTEQLQGITWLNNAAEVVLKSLILDFSDESKKIPAIMSEILATNDLSSRTKLAQNYNLSSLIELTPESHVAIVGKRNDIPFESSHFKQNTIGFHKQENQFVFSHLWISTQDSPPKRYFIAYKKPIKPLLDQLSVFGIDLSIVEKEREDRRLLFSSFTNETGQDLLEQTPFEQVEIESTKWTLNKEKYLIKMIDLSDDPKLQQKMVFSLKLPNYEAISVSEILIYIWTFFCISVVFLFFVFKKYELSDKLQEHQ